MKKVFSLLLSFFFLLSSLFVPTLSLAQEDKPEEVSSFELFWPIVAGKTEGDKLYFLKVWKEDLRGALIFSKYKKTDYNLTLSEKRAVELEKLLEKKDYENAKKTLEKSKEKRAKVQAYLKELSEEGTNTTDLRTTFKNSLEKQQKLYRYLLSKATEDQVKEIINSFLSSIESDISSNK